MSTFAERRRLVTLVTTSKSTTRRDTRDRCHFGQTNAREKKDGHELGRQIWVDPDSVEHFA